MILSNFLNKLSTHIYYKNSIRNERNYINNLIENEDFLPINNYGTRDIKTVSFIIPNIRAYGGGYTSILRLGTYLNKNGIDVEYITYGNQTIEELEKAARINLSEYEGKIFEKSRLDNMESDVVIATNWESVFYTKKLKGYKMYFVQDYEPYFHKYGELFLLAKKTYQLGFHMVSLGEWNKKKIELECGVNDIDTIDFPYENKEYKYFNRDYLSYKEKKELLIAVYIKPDGKRLPNILQLMMVNLKEHFLKIGISLQIKFFGSDKGYEVIVGENIGKLTKEELEELYRKSDFGMVASMSNISLVPYEMIATGLPIIEFEEGTFKHFFPKGSAILTSFSHEDLFEKLKYYIENPNEIIKMQGIAKNYIKDLSWERSGEQFKNILENTRKK